MKSKLVAFGEYTPKSTILSYLSDKLSMPMSSLQPYRNTQKPIKYKGYNIAVLICYEIGFPELVFTRANASDLIVVISDNAWFDAPIASFQHRQIAQFYGRVMQKPIVFVNNNGLTSIISNHGQILAELNMNASEVLKYNLNF